MFVTVSNFVSGLTQIVSTNEVEAATSEEGLLFVGQKLFDGPVIDESTHAEIEKYKFFIQRLKNENATQVIYTIIELIKNTFNKDCEINDEFEQQFALRTNISKEIIELKEIYLRIDRFFIDAMNHFNSDNRNASSIMSDKHWIQQINNMVLSKSSSNYLCFEKIYLKIDLIKNKS